MTRHMNLLKKDRCFKFRIIDIKELLGQMSKKHNEKTVDYIAQSDEAKASGSGTSCTIDNSPPQKSNLFCPQNYNLFSLTEVE